MFMFTSSPELSELAKPTIRRQKKTVIFMAVDVAEMWLAQMLLHK